MNSSVFEDILLVIDEIQVALFLGKTLQFALALAHAFLRLDKACMNAGSKVIPLILKLSIAL